MKLTRKQLKTKLEAIVKKYNSDSSMLVSILQDTQTEIGLSTQRGIDRPP